MNRARRFARNLKNITRWWYFSVFSFETNRAGRFSRNLKNITRDWYFCGFLFRNESCDRNIDYPEDYPNALSFFGRGETRSSDSGGKKYESFVFFGSLSTVRGKTKCPFAVVSTRWWKYIFRFSFETNRASRGIRKIYTRWWYFSFETNRARRFERNLKRPRDRNIDFREPEDYSNAWSVLGREKRGPPTVEKKTNRLYFFGSLSTVRVDSPTIGKKKSIARTTTRGAQWTRNIDFPFPSRSVERRSGRTVLFLGNFRALVRSDIEAGPALDYFLHRLCSRGSIIVGTKVPSRSDGSRTVFVFRAIPIARLCVTCTCSSIKRNGTKGVCETRLWSFHHVRRADGVHPKRSKGLVPKLYAKHCIRCLVDTISDFAVLKQSVGLVKKFQMWFDCVC